MRRSYPLKSHHVRKVPYLFTAVLSFSALVGFPSMGFTQQKLVPPSVLVVAAPAAQALAPGTYRFLTGRLLTGARARSLIGDVVSLWLERLDMVEAHRLGEFDAETIARILQELAPATEELNRVAADPAMPLPEEALLRTPTSFPVVRGNYQLGRQLLPAGTRVRLLGRVAGRHQHVTVLHEGATLDLPLLALRAATVMVQPMASTWRRLSDDETAWAVAASSISSTGGLPERASATYSSSSTGYSSGARTQHVSGYTRRDGTRVSSYYRSGRSR